MRISVIISKKHLKIGIEDIRILIFPNNETLFAIEMLPESLQISDAICEIIHIPKIFNNIDLNFIIPNDISIKDSNSFIIFCIKGIVKIRKNIDDKIRKVTKNSGEYFFNNVEMTKIIKEIPIIEFIFIIQIPFL